jgi:hypothetical protein
MRSPSTTTVSNVAASSARADDVVTAAAVNDSEQTAPTLRDSKERFIDIVPRLVRRWSGQDRSPLLKQV